MPWLTRLLLPIALASAAAVHAQGTTVAIGGALQDDNDAVWQRLVGAVPPAGDRACYAILTLASAEPEQAAARVAANLARRGGRGVALPVGPAVAALDRLPCRGVFMTGGAQARLLDALQPGGRASPLLQAMRRLWQDGGVIAGTSAGAAVLSEVVFRDAPEPLAVMKGRLREGLEWDRGFGFAPPGLVIDQHAVRRGRLGRLLPLMQAQRQSLGAAVEENTAAVFEGDTMSVVGARGVLMADLGATPSVTARGPFTLRGATLHWLEPGDRFVLAQRQVLPSPRKAAGTRLQPLAPGHQGYLPGPWFYSDILAEAMIVTAMTRLVDGDQRELRGLAFAAEPAADDPAPDLGFAWRLWLDAGSGGWLALNPEGYTLTGVRLDIVPVQVQRPLFRPLPPENRP